jgi:hypothetical protein
MLIRDLKRPKNSFQLWLFVTIFGKAYDDLQKKLYRDSLKAGFTEDEFREMSLQADIRDARIASYFPTHVGIEKFASDSDDTSPDYSQIKSNNFVDRMMYKFFITRRNKKR